MRLRCIIIIIPHKFFLIDSKIEWLDPSNFERSMILNNLDNTQIKKTSWSIKNVNKIHLKFPFFFHFHLLLFKRKKNQFNLREAWLL